MLSLHVAGSKSEEPRLHGVYLRFNCERHITGRVEAVEPLFDVGVSLFTHQYSTVNVYSLRKERLL